MARFQLFLLGGFSISLDDQPVTGFESDKVRALLDYIALFGDRLFLVILTAAVHTRSQTSVSDQFLGMREASNFTNGSQIENIQK